MAVVLDGQAKMPGRDVAGKLRHVFAGPHQLDDREGQVGEPQRIVCFLPLSETPPGLPSPGRPAA